jgi:hypothetical protein
MRFEQGMEFDTFLDRYPCKVFIVKHSLRDLVENFVSSPAWNVGFVGPTAAVFLRNDMVVPEEAASFAPDRFRNLKSPPTAFYVLGLVIETGDFDSARAILRTMRQDIRFFPFKSKIAEFRKYFEGMKAYEERDIESAIDRLEECRRGGVVWNDSLLIKLYNYQTFTLTNGGKERAAFTYARRALSLDANDPHALVNAGVLGWWLEKRAGDAASREENRVGPAEFRSRSFSWRASLKKFLNLYGGAEGMPASVVNMAKDILSGSYEGTLIILRPAL